MFSRILQSKSTEIVLWISKKKSWHCTTERTPLQCKICHFGFNIFNLVPVQQSQYCPSANQRSESSGCSHQAPPEHLSIIQHCWLLREEKDLAGVWVVEPLHQLDTSGLATAWGPDLGSISSHHWHPKKNTLPNYWTHWILIRQSFAQNFEAMTVKDSPAQQCFREQHPGSVWSITMYLNLQQVQTG